MKKPQFYMTSRIRKDPKHSFFSQHLQCMSPYGFEKLSIKQIYLKKEVVENQSLLRTKKISTI